MSRSHFSDYDQVTTGRCERALLTLLSDIGPWRERIYLAGGLAPRYLTGTLPDGVPAHVGTTDVDIIIGLAVADEAPQGRIHGTYAAFLASTDDSEENTRLRREAVATIRAFLDGFQKESRAPNTAP